MENEKKWYIYIIQEAVTKNFKVGYATNHEDRLHGLQIGNPRKLTLIYKEEFTYKEDVLYAEQSMHDYLRLSSLSGEWFEWAEYTETVIEKLKKYGIIKYIDYLKSEREFIFSSELPLKYQKIIDHISKMIGEDLEKGDIYYLDILQKELKLLQYKIGTRITERQKKQTGFFLGG